jgi:SAM-dependent methyltransferase
MQLSGMGCLYELPATDAVGDTVSQATNEGFTPAQQDAFEAHVARLILHYLSPLDEETAALMGVLRADGANRLAMRTTETDDGFLLTISHTYEKPDLPRIIDALIEGCTRQQKKYRHYLERTSWRVVADYKALWRHAPLGRLESALDIGAVPPLLAALLRDHIPAVAVADPGADAFAPYFEAHGIAWACADLLRDDPYPGRQFGLVCFCEVLEHLTGDVPGALDRVIAKVAPGGLLYVTTPNLRSISGLVTLLWQHKGIPSKWRETVRQQYARAGKEDGYYGHVREYTAREVITLFESFGLEHVASAYQTHPRAETAGRKLIKFAETLLPSWRLYGKYLFQKRSL